MAGDAILPFMIWNEGEKQLQARVGLREKLEVFGPKIMRPAMPRPHRALFSRVPFLVLGGMNAGRPASAIAYGAPGWVTSPDDRTLRIDLSNQTGDLGPVAVGDALGVLSIELATRQRIRMNGRVIAREGNVVSVTVDVSFGNCPQYIQARGVSFGPSRTGEARDEGAVLDAAALDVVARADTFFVASSARPDPAAGPASEGVDVSHRGGRPGFVVATEEEGATVLTWPDYPGNNFFNTLGNLLLQPWASLLFVDFATGTVLDVSGEAKVLWEGDERAVRLRVDHARLAKGALPLRFAAPELAPELE